MEVDVALRRGRPAVRGRAESPDERDLLERRGELGAEHAPLDAGHVVERGLDRRPLALAVEVRAQAGAEVTGLADVEHLAVGVVEEVDAGAGRGAVDQVALRVDAARPGRRELLELRERRRALLAGELDQPQEDLGGRLRVGKRAVAGLDGHAEEVGERGEARAADAPAEQVTGERHRVDHGRVQALAGHPLELPVDEADVEARVVGDENGAAGELRETPERQPDSWGGAELLVGQAGEEADRAGERGLRRDERLVLAGELEVSDADGADLADARGRARKAGGLEVEDDELGLAEERVGRRRERDERSAPAEARVAVDERAEELSGESLGRLLDREEE